MSKIAIVYHSATGTTHLLAEAIARGAQSIETTEVELHRIQGTQITEGRWSDDPALQAISSADAIVFGSPTYVGNVSAQFKAFADATGGIWYTQGWKDKFAAGFTVSGSPSGDKFSTLSYLNAFAAQHGMTWINLGLLPVTASRSPDGVNRLGSFIGVMGQSTPGADGSATVDRADLLTAEAYGRRIAETVQRFSLAAVA